MRTSTVSFLIGLIATVGRAGTNAPASAAERRVFRYGDAANGGALIHDYANRWIEFVGPAEKYYFEEQSRSDDAIELLDRSRGIGLQKKRILDSTKGTSFNPEPSATAFAKAM